MYKKKHFLTNKLYPLFFGSSF